MKDLTGYTGAMEPFRIRLKHDQPIYTPPRRHSVVEEEVQNEKFGELRDANIICRCVGDKYASAVVVAAKKDPTTGQYTDKRVTVDMRPVNAATEMDRYQLPLADDLFHLVGEACVFSKLDLRSGFFQLHIAEEDMPKTAFHWQRELWMYRRVPMGAKCSPPYYQRVVDFELARAGCMGFARAFIDDVLIFSRSGAEHVEHVRRVLDALQAVGLKPHPAKCVFGTAVCEFLGHDISNYGVHPNQAKVAAIRALQPPRNVGDLRALLGLMSYYRMYVPQFAVLAKPLNDLLKQGTVKEWSADCQGAFDQLKEALCRPGNCLRRVQPNLPLVVYSDWSKCGIGGVLAQVELVEGEQREFLCACTSRSLNAAEGNYSSFHGEMLAAVWSVKQFRHYLHGRHFYLVTDHEPLRYLMTKPDLSGQHARWAMMLAEFDFTVEHRPGAKHTNADILSRQPLPTQVDVTGARLDSAVAPFVYREGALPRIRAAWQRAVVAYGVGWDSVDAYAEHGVVVWDGTPVRQLCAAVGVSAPQAGPGQQLPGWAEVDVEAQRRLLLAVVRSAVARAGSAVPVVSEGHQSLRVGPGRLGGVYRQVVGLDTHPIGQQFFARAAAQGVTLFEPFGGMCAGLEVCLRVGLGVRRYIYSDIDPVAQTVAAYRMQQLSCMYPSLLSPEAYADALVTLPHNVQRISAAQLLQAGVMDGSQWLVVAGWECQDLSPAGLCRGLEGPRSSTYYDLLRVVGLMQQMQRAAPPGWLLENAAMQHNSRSALISGAQFQQVCAALGTPVCFDAAQVGSHAHRLRNYWTNLGDARQVAAVLQQLGPPPERRVQDVLDAGALSQPALLSDRHPQWPVNQRGGPLRALPTLVAYQGSRAFRDRRQGCVWDEQLGVFREPNPDERERALGYAAGSTAAPGVTPQQRHQVTGRCIDANALAAVVAVCMCTSQAAGFSGAVCELGPLPEATSPSLFAPSPPLTVAEMQRLYGRGYSMVLQAGWLLGTALGRTPQRALLTPLPCAAPRAAGAGLGYHKGHTLGSASSPSPTPQWVAAGVVVPPQVMVQAGPAGVSVDLSLYLGSQRQQLLYEQAVASEGQWGPQVHRDIWLDSAALLYLQEGKLPVGLNSAQQQAAVRRAGGYVWDGSVLHRCMPDGSRRVVPPPAQRGSVVSQVHAQCGHFGEKRTISLLLTGHWWYGLYRDVYRLVKACQLCRRVNATFTARPDSLQPLPIEGLFYRWGVDLFGPVQRSEGGNVYCLIAIEHLSKHIELMPLPDKEAATTAQAFLAHVLSRFGACAEVLTDRGSEWRGEFAQLLEQCLIDHRVTSADHPQTNGLAERCVQTIKRALRKLCAQALTAATWDRHLAWIALGYRCSVQLQTKLSPYYVLYARQPVIPPAVVERWAKPLDLDDPEAAAVMVLARAQVAQRAVVMAGGNLRIAQHRDTLRYAHRRSGQYVPRGVKFQVGDYVYVQQQQHDTLHIAARAPVLRVTAVGDSGVVTLQGKCGRTVKRHMQLLAPCHLPDLDGTVDPTLERFDPDKRCEVCNLPDDAPHMLLCDWCNCGWHMQCLSPPVQQSPAVWLCPYCVGLGITVAQARQRQRALQALAPVHDEGNLVSPSAATKGRDRRAAALDGRLLVKVEREGGREVPVWGRVHFVGVAQRPAYFKVAYEDGSVYEHVQMRHFSKLLMPEGTQLPAGVAIPPLGDASERGLGQAVVAAAAAGGVEALPQQWEGSPPLYAAGLQLVLPGLYSQAVLRGLERAARKQKMPWAGALAHAQALAELLQVVSVERLRGVLDPYGQFGGLPAAVPGLAHLGLALPSAPGGTRGSVGRATVYMPDQPGYWRDAQQQAPADLVVFAPPSGVADVVVSLAAQFMPAVCALCSASWWAGRHAARHAWLQRLQEEGRLLLLPVVSALDSQGCAGIWVCIFRSCHARCWFGEAARPGVGLPV
jgi:transposase InsO family protein